MCIQRREAPRTIIPRVIFLGGGMPFFREAIPVRTARTKSRRFKASPTSRSLCWLNVACEHLFYQLHAGNVAGPVGGLSCRSAARNEWPGSIMNETLFAETARYARRRHSRSGLPKFHDFCRRRGLGRKNKYATDRKARECTHVRISRPRDAAV